MTNQAIAFTKRERAFFYACLYLGMLFLSSVVMWWMILVGGQPFTAQNLELVGLDGKPRSEFSQGEVMGVKRKICSSRPITLQFHPRMQMDNGFWFALPGAAVKTVDGCFESIYGVVIPGIPPGSYTYTNTVTFQNNLVGRDEDVVFPSFKVRILPHAD